MRTHDEDDAGRSALGVLLGAAIEATGQGMVVVDRGGRVAYASLSARSLVAELAKAGPGDNMIARLMERGGRRIPLQVGTETLGEAVFFDPPGTDTSLAERERRAILETLQSTGGRLAAAARHLGISRTTLWRRLRAYGLRRAR